MAYDSEQSQVLLFGGLRFTDTWVWDENLTSQPSVGGLTSTGTMAAPLSFPPPPPPVGAAMEPENRLLERSSASTPTATQTTCTDPVFPSGWPTGWARPCPVFNVVASMVLTSGSLTITVAPPTNTTAAYVYQTYYLSDTAWNCPGKQDNWCPRTLDGPTDPGASAYLTRNTGSTTTVDSGTLANLALGTHYLAAWDWVWDATANGGVGCYKGPALNACNTGEWQLQMFKVIEPRVFPINGYTPYTVLVSSVLDHDRDLDIIISYTGERGRQVDGCDNSPNCKKGYLDGFSGHAVGMPPVMPSFVVNGVYTGGTYLNYEEFIDSTWTYQHPGYDYPAQGTIAAPAGGKLYIVGASGAGQPKADPINGYHNQGSAWCGYHTFKLVHSDGTESWFLHADRLLNKGENGALQDLDKMAHVALGDSAYNCTTPLSQDTHLVFIADVTGGEALATVGSFGAVDSSGVKHTHLHYEARSGAPCDLSGSSCLIDPYGWEGDGTDPLSTNPGIIMWQGYTQPTVTSATLDTGTSTVLIVGADFVQGNLPTSVEVWHKLDQQSTGPNSNDGTRVKAADLTIRSKTNNTIIADVTQDIITNRDAYVVKVAIKDGPRSRAVSFSIQ